MTGSGPSEKMVASGVPTGSQASPGSTRIFSSLPAAQDSTSTFDLSVSITSTTSPRAIGSPGFFSHSTTRPSVMSAPSLGIRKSTAAASR